LARNKGETMTFIPSLDQGTTSSCALVFDANGSVIATAQQEFPQIFSQPGCVKHDPMAT
jgi:glycerol kinase